MGPHGGGSDSVGTSRADDVQIDILYYGVCHSDLHTVRNERHNTLYPSVPGHEIVSRVTAARSLDVPENRSQNVGAGKPARTF